MPSKTIYKQQFPKHGYEIRTEMTDNPVVGGKPTKSLKAYTISGAYIGEPATAKTLCEEMGIRPEKTAPQSEQCTIGFCENDQKWYGWSRLTRIAGFGIGSTAKHQVAAPPEPTPETDEDPAPRRHKRHHYLTEDISEKWTAITLNDAKQMAIDFANA